MSLPNALKSRKFWLCAIGVIAGIVLAVIGTINGDQTLVDKGVNLIMLSVGSYVAAEGTADVVGRYKQGEIDKIQKLADVDTEVAEKAGSTDAGDRDIVSGFTKV